MRRLLDRLDPCFAASAIAIAGLTVMSQVPYPLIPVNLPDIHVAWLEGPAIELD
ncbi:hypothetical protein [Halomicronema sp. CCY15110]|uniref:hypothetical protein n=1 Tax=Halomicronema sp. CCY15110 TaxID=2767773 RepID=UPI00194F7B93|nr:hypothetical protein [Halomicronema sp. CCY15110]